MKTNGLLVVVVLAVELAACAKHVLPPCALIPVPAADSRSDRFPMPLTPEAGTQLVRSLSYGLNRNNERDDVGVTANAEAKYRDLIALLSEPKQPALPELGSPPFKKWFPAAPFLQVVDARDRSTPAQDQSPVAASDGTYWWIFYHDRDRLTGVMVVKLNACQTLVEANR